MESDKWFTGFKSKTLARSWNDLIKSLPDTDRIFSTQMTREKKANKEFKESLHIELYLSLARRLSSLLPISTRVAWEARWEGRPVGLGLSKSNEKDIAVCFRS